MSCLLSFIALSVVLFMLFRYFLFTVYHVIIMYTLFICTSTFPFSYTLIKSLSDDPKFARPDTECFSLFRCLMSCSCCKEPESPSVRSSVFLFSFIPLISYSLCTSLSYHYIPAIILLFLYIRLGFYSISMFIVIMCGHLYAYCSDHDLLIYFCSLFGLFKT